MMTEKEKTAPSASVGADAEQSSQSIATDIIQQNGEEIKWLSDENKINEPLFCDYFCHNRELCCIGGQFYSVDGMESSEQIKAKIAAELRNNGITTSIATRVKSLFEALKLYCHREPIKPKEDEIHMLNGYLKTDGTFIAEKKLCSNRLNIEYHQKTGESEFFTTNFQKFLYQLLDAQDIMTLQEYLGYCLIPSTKAQTALFIIGNGGEGKSRLGVVLKEIFGESMITGDFHRIENDKFFRYNLLSKLLMNDDDMQMTALKSTGYIKNIITAEIPIDVEAKGQQSQQAYLYSRFLCFGNGSPKALYDKSDGFARRLLILTTKPKPSNRCDDPFLAQKFIAEKEIIFDWMFAGLQRLIRNNYHFTVSAKTRSNVEEAISDNCNIVEFLKEQAEISERAEISSTAIYQIYCEWCEENALTALKRETFISWLKTNADKYGFRYSNSINRNGNRVRGFKGIFLRTSLNGVPAYHTHYNA